ncbi:MAG: ABC transporter substrate-binding protein [Syntrophomonadaceae bacterium]|nr:ABC transporter substrate-binding protein [Syntrophomonadaceae bacterium]
MRKVIIGALILLILLGGTVFYMYKHNSTPTIQPLDQVVLLNPSGPTVIPVIGLDSKEVTEELNVQVQYWNNIDEVLASLAKDEAQFLVMPISAGVNIYNRGIDIALLGVHEWKVFYLIARDGIEFADWHSMKNKNVYTPVGKGQTADVLMRSSLKEVGLEPGVDVNINYAPPQEIVALFKEGKVDFAALPEPFVTMAIQGGKGQIVLDFQKYWGNMTGLNERIPIAGLFVTKNFLKDYPRETEMFVDLFNKSIIWSNENSDLAIEKSQDILPIPPAIIKSALERIDFYYIPSQDCQTEVNTFLTKIKELDSESISQVPDSGFYAK